MNLTPDTTQLFATICFALAILHTFSVKRFQHFAQRYEAGSVGENLFHLLGEVEVVFGIWAALFLVFFGITQSPNEAVHYLETRNFTEPAFVFVIMAICATRPILVFTSNLIETASRILPFRRPIAFYATCMILGPIMGSFITEPAAMTVTALILLERYFSRPIPLKLKYATIGLLFVNISIGGTLTPFAAPPVLMVAKQWSWDLNFMMTHFGWKSVLAIILATTLVTVRFREDIKKVSWEASTKSPVVKIPFWVSATHLVFLAVVVLSSHFVVVFFGVFLFFLGLISVTREYQDEVKLREGLLVAFFLGGLVILGGPQRWWLEPLLTRLDALPLFLGGISLTAITDNAALTYLGSQVPNLSEASRYALVAGAVTGGGLTVIANAPNPAGYGILNSAFGDEGISPILLLASALPPTLIAACCFWVL